MKVVYLFIILLFIGNIYCEGQVKYAKFEDILTLGADESKGLEYLFSKPRFIEVDSKKNIYVIDLADMRIRKFSSKGKFLKYIGRRGRGPGEFMDFSFFEILSNDRLLICDMMNARITIFDANGQIENSFNIDFNLMLWPKGIIELNSNYLVISDLIYKKGLFHLLTGSFDKNLLTFGIESYPESLEEKAFHTASMPSYFKIDDSEFLYSHSNYMGYLGHYKFVDEKWQFHKVDGYTYFEPSIERLSNNVKETGEYSIRGFIQGEKVVARVNNESRGIVKILDGKIAHFTLIRKNRYKILGVEIYNTKNFSFNYFEISMKKLNSNFIGDIPIRVFNSDDEGNLYLLDESERFPLIKKVKLILDVN